MKYFVSITFHCKLAHTPEGPYHHFTIVLGDNDKKAEYEAVSEIQKWAPWRFKVNYIHPMEGRESTKPVLPLMRAFMQDAEYLKRKGDPLWKTAEALYDNMYQEFCDKV